MCDCICSSVDAGDKFKTRQDRFSLLLLPTRLVQHDVRRNRAILAFQGSHLKIDVAMLGDDFPFKIEALFQFIGDLQRDEVPKNRGSETMSGHARHLML